MGGRFSTSWPALVNIFDQLCIDPHIVFSQIMENAEINNIIKIVGLQYKKSYDDPESLRSLRYGKIMIMTDQVSRLTDSLTHSRVSKQPTCVCVCACGCRIRTAPTSKDFSSTSSITTGRRCSNTHSWRSSSRPSSR